MMEAHFDVGAKKNCYALGWSYGEICVGCGCCSSDPVKRVKARVKYHEWELDYFLNFKFEDDPEWLAEQKKNVASSIEYNRKMVEKYKKELEVLEVEAV